MALRSVSIALLLWHLDALTIPLFEYRSSVFPLDVVVVECPRVGWHQIALESAGGPRLNACMQCDEIYCSAYYLQACGANRRTAGVVSDIARPGEHICKAAREDALKRGTPTRHGP